MIVMARRVGAVGETRDTANILQHVGQASPLPQRRPIQWNGHKAEKSFPSDGQQAVEKKGDSRFASLLPRIRSHAAPLTTLCLSKEFFSTENPAGRGHCLSQRSHPLQGHRRHHIQLIGDTPWGRPFWRVPSGSSGYQHKARGLMRPLCAGHP